MEFTPVTAGATSPRTNGRFLPFSMARASGSRTSHRRCAVVRESPREVAAVRTLSPVATRRWSNSRPSSGAPASRSRSTNPSSKIRTSASSANDTDCSGSPAATSTTRRDPRSRVHARRSPRPTSACRCGKRGLGGSQLATAVRSSGYASCVRSSSSHGWASRQAAASPPLRRITRRAIARKRGSNACQRRPSAVWSPSASCAAVAASHASSSGDTGPPARIRKHGAKDESSSWATATSSTAVDRRSMRRGASALARPLQAHQDENESQ